MTAKFLIGDVLQQLETLKTDSVDLVLTSPPFLALRSYLPADHPDKHLEGGSQATPGLFIDWLVDVVEALDRVLAPHGSLCVELGDTFSGSGGAGGDYNNDGLREGQPKFRQVGSREHRPEREGTDADGGSRVGPINAGPSWPLAKSLTLIPELFRTTLVYGTNPLTGRQTEPWRLRNVIRWVRPNPPVGALGDKFRPATSELMVFCKSAKRYFDLDSVREPYSANTNARTAKGLDEIPRTGKSADRDGNWSTLPERNNDGAGAPPLDWWNIPTHGYKGAHYAAFPPALCVKPIKAMSPSRVCLVCGEPSRRIVESGDYTEAAPMMNYQLEGNAERRLKYGTNHANPFRLETERRYRGTTAGWSSCGHDDWRPGHVLDPFAGSGTVLAVATGHGRDATGIDLDERNAGLALDRVGPLLLEVVNT